MKLRVGRLVLVRFGSAKTQLAVVLGRKDGLVHVRKWKDKAGRFGMPTWLPERDVRGKPERDDARLAAARAELASPANATYLAPYKTPSDDDTTKDPEGGATC